MPLDLSPLATPIIRSKIEEPSVVETTHQDSPLPHPESTTSDEKVRNFIFLVETQTWCIKTIPSKAKYLIYLKC